MRLAFLWRHFAVRGGIERALIQRVNLLAADGGNEVHLVTYNQYGRPMAFPLSPLVRHTDLATRYAARCRYSGPGQYPDRWRSRREWRRAVVLCLRAIAPDVVTVTDFLHSEIEAALEAQDGKPVVVESHSGLGILRLGAPPQGAARRLKAAAWHALTLRAARRADRVVALTPGDEAEWRAAGCRAALIPNMLAIPPQPPRERGAARRRVLCVGRLDRNKGHDLLLRAWELVAERHPGWTLDIYGDPEAGQPAPPRGRSATGAAFHPSTAHIEREYLRSDILVLSSRYEPFGLVLTEAMACGLPVVSFDCPHGPRSVITDGENGLLCPPGDTDALARAVCRLIESPALREKLGRAARRRADDFLPDRVMPLWTRLYARLAATRGPGGGDTSPQAAPRVAALLLVFHGLNPDSGISKKILAQADGLRRAGLDTRLCTYDRDGRGHRCRFVDGRVLQDFGRGSLAALRKRVSYGAVADYCRREGVRLVYVRSFHNANPWTARLMARLRRGGARVVMEIPTYPYDAEYRGAPPRQRLALMVDKLFRRALARETDAVVTFSPEREIFGRRTIRISNGVDLQALPLRRPRESRAGELHLLGVAEVHPWHGYDRVVSGLAQYRTRGGRADVYFHVAGPVNSRVADAWRQAAREGGAEAYLVLHGPRHGAELDALFDMADLGVGSLGRHRTGIDCMKTLKNREYAARGLAFMYSETDDDFEGAPYVMKVPPDDSPLDIEAVLRFRDALRVTPREIRQSAARLSWEAQMAEVARQALGPDTPRGDAPAAPQRENT